jgi:ribosomal protein S18 acetylase RimI-like enzyme
MRPTALRPVTPADFPALHALIRGIEEHDRLPVALTLEELEEWRSDPHLDLAADTRVLELDGRLVAWGRIWFRPSGEREERAYLVGGVDGAQRGRGFGRAMLAWQIERANTLFRAQGNDLPKWLRTQAYEEQEADHRLYRRAGFARARVNDELLRPIEPLPARVDVPGIAIVPWDAARSEDARVAQNDAFADHWGSTPIDPAAWSYELTRHGTRLDLSFLALDTTAGNRVVGVCRNGEFPGDEAVTGRRDGWVLNVSVVRAQRKRGIATALLVASLAAFQRAGFTHSALGVDSENPTGAYGVYERLGWRRIHRLIVHQKPYEP